MEPYEIKQQLEALPDSVERFKPDQLVAATVGKQGNALRTELASALPDNPVIAATPPFAGTGRGSGARRPRGRGRCARGLASQVPRRAPSIA